MDDVEDDRDLDARLAAAGHRTRAAHDPDLIPASPFGPGLASITALLTGVYHLSRRRAAKLLSDLLGVRISLGRDKAVEARVSEARHGRASKAPR